MVHMAFCQLGQGCIAEKAWLQIRRAAPCTLRSRNCMLLLLLLLLLLRAAAALNGFAL
jgi:hypothetical protein